MVRAFLFTICNCDSPHAYEAVFPCFLIFCLLRLQTAAPFATLFGLAMAAGRCVLVSAVGTQRGQLP